MIGGGRFAILRSTVVKIRAIKSGNLKSFGPLSAAHIWLPFIWFCGGRAAIMQNKCDLSTSGSEGGRVKRMRLHMEEEDEATYVSNDPTFRAKLETLSQKIYFAS